ncbi:MAG: phosphoribosylformylglycinamidine synthase subunit PurS [Candidatus Atribacteria bacterium]|nr:phosphoribosylformylglycinamidine synthase subunit PurS [Candidatus Atribacteria bacterium]MCD6349948.1 phosphoribosylformylglycinamidine synthase subunit PurS [Candidatus Atribacteria bacterium]
MKYRGKVIVTLKDGVFDPQGVTIKNALHSLSFEKVEEVKTGKFFEVLFCAESDVEAEKLLKEMCRQLLANPIIEDFSFSLEKI